MKAVWLKEVRQTTESAEFRKWLQALDDLRKELQALEEQAREIASQISLTSFRSEQVQKEAIDNLYRAGEYDDEAARLRAESAEIENKSYEAVANFENQRIYVSGLYSRMGALEHHLLSVRSEVEGLDKALQASRDREQRADIEKTLKRKRNELSKIEREFKEAADLYERESRRKSSLWKEVEHLWARALDLNLSVAEKKVKSKRCRMVAEKMFRKAEQLKESARRLEQELEASKGRHREKLQQFEHHLKEAGKLFDCLVGEEFLYWPAKEKTASVYCVPVANQPAGYNIDLEAGQVYLVDRQRGVEFIEPLPPGGMQSQDNDPRIDEFFKVRPGAKATAAAKPSDA
ncbi:MAG: hypothetical protein D6806_04555 [Deltaproteobacteria bacterium]|nr:MAG: hypothetical protein D6806_04555 [Deltaproteobacteria bacterium]